VFQDGPSNTLAVSIKRLILNSGLLTSLMSILIFHSLLKVIFSVPSRYLYAISVIRISVIKQYLLPFIIYYQRKLLFVIVLPFKLVFHYISLTLHVIPTDGVLKHAASILLLLSLAVTSKINIFCFSSP